MRKPRAVDPDRAVQATLERIYTARTLASRCRLGGRVWRYEQAPAV